ncbi:hypothetical protein Tco_1469349 [Tanacetum coccineum]
MFSIRIHHGGRFHKFPGTRYVDGAIDIFDMVDIKLFYMKGCMLWYDEDIRCLAMLVRSFKLVEVYIEHCYTIVLSYLRALPQGVRATIKDVSEPNFVDESVTPRSIPHVLLAHPIDEYIITYTQLSDVQALDIQDHVLPTILHISFDDMELHEVAIFGDVADVAQTESQEEVIMSKVLDDHVVNESDTYVDVETAVVGRTKEPVVEHVIVDELYMVVVRNLLNRVMMGNLLNMIVANKSNMMLTGSIVVRIIKVSIIIL